VTAVCAVRSIELAVSDLERSTAFYTEAWALDVVATVDGVRYFRAAGSDHYILGLREESRPHISAIEFALPSREDIDVLAERLAIVPGLMTGRPAAIARPGGGYGIDAADQLGRAWRFTADVAPATAQHSPDRPFKISHVVLNSPTRELDIAFARDVLGFRVRDVTRGMTFLGCNADHHSLAIADGGEAALNHVAFDVDSIDAVMRGVGRLKRYGHPMQWGIGRHGPGGNVFSYYLDPDDFAVEFTAEVQQVDDAVYRVGTPADWDRPPYWDAWGQAEPPSERFRAASFGLARTAAS
jgi:catechol 2,3-dioxygenase-like lactoylglutathione lyase family enzyme